MRWAWFFAHLRSKSERGEGRQAAFGGNETDKKEGKD